MRKLDDVFKQNVNGLCYGNRVLLPFAAHILKVAVEDDLIMDFSTNKKGAEYFIKEDFTEIYFHDFESLKDVVSKFEVIKMVIVEKGNDPFDLNNHRKISVDILENHKTKIEELDKDSIFIE